MSKEDKTKTVVKGKTVYEINKFTGKPTRIVYGIDKYNERRANDDDRRKSAEEQELNYHERLENSDTWENTSSAHERREEILSLIGNKKKRVLKSKADGFDKEIAIIDTEPEPVKKKDLYNRYRKRKPSKTKSKRKVTKCRCKK
jgi:hypothetical protein